MEKIWLKCYPASAPAEVDVHAYASIPDMFAQSCSRFADLPAFSNAGTTLSYAQTDTLSRQFAAWLQAQPGLSKGDRVAIMLPNLLQYPVALLGIQRAGLVVVNINPLYTPRELEHQLRDAGAKVIILLDSLAPLLKQVIGTTQIQQVVTTQVTDLLQGSTSPVGSTDLIGTSLPAALAAGAVAPFQEATLTHADIAFLQYTGGTTGVSKGAILTHGNLIANLQQADAWLGTVFAAGRETVITALPLYHIFALTINCLLFMKCGGHNRLITNPRDMPALVKELAISRFTALTGVNTLFNGLLNTPGFADIDFSGVKLVMGGGAAVQRAIAERWLEVTGHRLVEGYGLTETSPLATCNLVAIGHTGSIGVPVPSTEACICADDGTELPIGTAGEICLRGPQVMQGYWQQPAETAKVLSPDGWFHTGDVGFIDATGAITLTDRKKDMILVSGFNVYPNEIEGVIAAHPGVFECAVVGIADEKTGEAVKAYVVSKDGTLSADDIIAYCRENLTSYKVPKQVAFIAELPKSPVGKILRRELRGR